MGKKIDMTYNRKLLNIPVLDKIYIHDPSLDDNVVLRGSEIRYEGHIDGIIPSRDRRKTHLLTNEAYKEFRVALNALENGLDGAKENMRSILREIDAELDI